jgi:predicted nucleotidyltransferase component of viral defense system
MQLKAFIKKKAEENRISAQLVMQNYMMERILERISLSKYKQNFILKGGFLIAAIVGLDTRTTMDLDATVKGFPLSHESINEIFNEICAISVEDEITFSVSRITDIREGDIYPGLRVHLTASYPPLSVPLSVDITSGDKITPREIEYSFRLMFDERSISVFAYNLETIFAEKIETVLSRNIANTRPRDFYDIYILYSLRGSDCDLAVLRQAINETANRRGSLPALEQYRDIIKNIRGNQQMQGFWNRYQKDFDYAKDITFDDACNSVLLIMDKITEICTRTKILPPHKLFRTNNL